MTYIKIGLMTHINVGLVHVGLFTHINVGLVNVGLLTSRTNNI